MAKHRWGLSSSTENGLHAFCLKCGMERLVVERKRRPRRSLFTTYRREIESDWIPVKGMPPCKENLPVIPLVLNPVSSDSS